MILIFIVISSVTLTESTEIVDRATFIANNEFHHRISTSVIWWRSDQNEVTDFLTNYHGLVTTVKIRKQSKHNFVGKFEQIVFFTADPGEFEYFLTNINETVINPIRVLLVITLPIKDVTILERYTKISLDNDVSDIVIISTRANVSNVTLTTYKPYLPERCGNHDPVTIAYDTKLFFPQTFNNFNKCPITVTISNSFPYTIAMDNNVDNIRGMDIEFLDIVFEKLNASMLKFLSSNSGAHVLEEVVAGDYDMCLPSVILNLNRFSLAQASNVYKTLDIVICAPNRREIYAWAKVLFPFFTDITPLITLSFLVFLVSLVLIQRFGKFRKNIPKSIIFGTLGLFLGQEIKFETKYWLNNGVFMLWIWYCTIVRIAYQSDLVEGLQSTFLEPRLKTVEEALRALDEFIGTEGLMALMPNNLTSLRRRKIIKWKNIPQYIEEVSKGKRVLLLTDISLIRHSNYTVQFIDERLSNMPAVFFMRPRWGAAVEINRRMMQLFEAGFMTKIASGYKAKRQEGSTGSNIDPMTLNTVASCFFGLLILGFLCSIVLCIEIIWHHFKKKNK